MEVEFQNLLEGLEAVRGFRIYFEKFQLAGDGCATLAQQMRNGCRFTGARTARDGVWVRANHFQPYKNMLWGGMICLNFTKGGLRRGASQN